MIIEKLQGFFKVAEDYSYSLKHVVMFNPITGEEKNILVDDTEYGYMERYDFNFSPQEIEYLRYDLEVNEIVKNLWLDSKNIIHVGSKVKVIKGRKIPIGTEAVVKSMYDYKDRYGRYVATYLIFENGQKTSILNCENITSKIDVLEV